MREHIASEQNASLRYVMATPGFNTDEVIIHAGSLLQDRPHPLGTAVLAYARVYGIDLLTAAHVESHPGKGWTGRVNGKISALGNAALMEEAGIDLGTLHADAQVLHDQGANTYFLSIGDHLAGLLAMSGTEES